MWDRHPELKPTVATCWQTVVATTVGDVNRKLGALSDELGKWGVDTLGNVKKEIKKLKNELDRLRNLPGRVGPSLLEINVNDKLVELYHREEIMWRQRSRVQWLSEGDKNSKYFHQRASMRRRKNIVRTLTRQDGQAIDDRVEMQNMVDDFYKNLYTSKGVQGMDHVLNHVPRKVTPAMNGILTAEFEPEEVKKALF